VYGLPFLVVMVGRGCLGQVGVVQELPVCHGYQGGWITVGVCSDGVTVRVRSRRFGGVLGITSVEVQLFKGGWGIGPVCAFASGCVRWMVGVVAKALLNLSFKSIKFNWSGGGGSCWQLF